MGSGLTHLRLLAVHREEGRVKLVEARQLSRAGWQALEAHWPPPVIACDHVRAVHEVAPELCWPIGLGEPARQPDYLSHCCCRPVPACGGTQARRGSKPRQFPKTAVQAPPMTRSSPAAASMRWPISRVASRRLCPSSAQACRSIAVLICAKPPAHLRQGACDSGPRGGLGVQMSAPLAAKAAPSKPAPITIFNRGTLPQNRADVSSPRGSFGGCAGTNNVSGDRVKCRCLSIHGVSLPQPIPLAPLCVASPLQWIMHTAGSSVPSAKGPVQKWACLTWQRLARRAHLGAALLTRVVCMFDHSERHC